MCRRAFIFCGKNAALTFVSVSFGGWGGGVDKLWTAETSEGWMVIVAGQGVIWGSVGLSREFRYPLSSEGQE